jgi:hypothetical protein
MAQFILFVIMLFSYFSVYYSYNFIFFYKNHKVIMQLNNQKLSLLLITSFAFIPGFAMEKEIIDSGSDMGSIDNRTSARVQPPSKPLPAPEFPGVYLKPKDLRVSPPDIPALPENYRIPRIVLPPQHKAPVTKAINGFVQGVYINGKYRSVIQYPINRNLIYNDNRAEIIKVISFDNFWSIKEEYDSEIMNHKNNNEDLKKEISNLHTRVVCTNPSDHAELQTLKNEVKELARIKKISSYLLGGTMAASFGAALFTIITNKPNSLFNLIGFKTNYSAPIIASGFATLGASSYLLGRYLGIFPIKK